MDSDDDGSHQGAETAGFQSPAQDYRPLAQRSTTLKKLISDEPPRWFRLLCKATKFSAELRGLGPRMTSNLPAQLAVFRFFAKPALFWIEAGKLLDNTHETYTQGNDVMGRPRPACKGKLSILTYDGRLAGVEYSSEEKLHCVIDQPVIAVMCNGRFVGYHDFSRDMHYWFGNLSAAAGSAISAADYFKPQFKTIVWGAVALWWSQGLAALTSLLLLHGRADMFMRELPADLGRFCLAYFIPLTIITLAMARWHKARAEKHVRAILDYALRAIQQRALPTAWHEVSEKKGVRGVRALFPALAGLAALAPMVLTVFFYLRTAKPDKLPTPPTMVSVVIWLCLLISGLLFTWALAATRWGRKVAWLLGLATILLTGSLEPWAVRNALYEPVRWVQLGWHFWLIFLPLAALWYFAGDASGTEPT